MKHFVIILTLLLTTVNGYCDTVDYWHVYLNDKLIAKFNSLSKDLTVRVKRTELKRTDRITVKYGSDHPCADCYYGLTIVGDFERKAPTTETTEHFGKLSISVKDLLDIEKTDGIDKFQFNYYERKKTSKIDNELDEKILFVLTLI